MDAAALASERRDDVARVRARARRRHAPPAPPAGRRRHGPGALPGAAARGLPQPRRRRGRRPAGRATGCAAAAATLPRVVADDRAGTVLLGATALALLAIGLAHRPAIEAEARDFERQAVSARRYVLGSAGPEFRGNVDLMDTIKQGPDLYRTCVPGPDPRRSFCVLVTTDQDPPGVTRDPDQRPNATVSGPDNPGRRSRGSQSASATGCSRIALMRPEELGRGRAREDPVVAGDGQVHRAAHDDLAVAHHRLGLELADGEDGRLRRVDDRREARHAVHAQVGDRERPARQLRRGDLAVAHLLGQSRASPRRSGRGPCGRRRRSSGR